MLEATRAGRTWTCLVGGQDQLGVATAADQAPEPPDEPSVGGQAEVPEELVSWDTAHERLDHERSFDRPHEPAN